MYHLYMCTCLYNNENFYYHYCQNIIKCVKLFRGGLKHGHYFTFKSAAGEHVGVILSFADHKHPYAALGPGLHVLEEEYLDLLNW